MRALAILTALTLAACTAGGTTMTSRTSTTQPAALTTAPASTTTSTTTKPRPIGGQLVKLDLETLRPVPGLEPIPMVSNSWDLVSADGQWIVIFEYAGDILDGMTSVDVDSWEVVGTFGARAHSARVIHEGRLYMYDGSSGQVLSLDLITGQLSNLGEWKPDLGIWDELHVVDGGRIAALGEVWDGADSSFSIFVLDPLSGETSDIPVGPIQHIDQDTGVFDGENEIWETDSPGLVWRGDSLFIVHADGPEVSEVDLDTGEVDTHVFDATSWLTRFLAFWVPAASAKGPSLGTYSSAALSPDGRYLFVSGNRHDVVTADDGTLVEESEHLGLTVIDTKTWGVIDQPDLPFQFVRNAGGMIMGVNTKSTSPWIDDVYVVSIDNTGAVDHQGPFTVEGGGCQPVNDPSRLVCSENVGGTGQTFVSVVDLATSEVTTSPEIGSEDYLHHNGVLVDWSPLGG